MPNQPRTAPLDLKSLILDKMKPDDHLMPRQEWTRYITWMMLVLITLAALLVAGGILAGLFLFEDSYVVFIAWILIFFTWQMSRGKAWRIASLFPPVLCFSLGVYGSYLYGLVSTMLLFYPLAVLLASYLLGSAMRRIMVAICIVTHVSLSLIKNTFTAEEIISSIIIFSFCLIGTSLLLWYFDSRMRQLLTAQIKGNMALEEEIALRQEAEDARRVQEAQLRRLAENTTDMVVETDPNGVIRYASPSHRAGLGYDPEALVGKSAFSLITLEDVPSARLAAQQCFASRQPVRVEVRVQHADGHLIPVEICGSPVYDARDTFTGFVVSSRNISHQKQAARILYESEARFRSVVESNPLGIHMYTLREDGSLIFSGYNPAANSILNFDHAVILGKTIEEAFPPLADSEIPDQYRQVAQTGDPWESEQFSYSDGKISGVYSIQAFQSTPDQVVILFDDITERIRSAEALRLSEDKFSKAFLASPDSININRLADGVYIDINQGFTNIMGYTRQDVLGISSLDLNIWVDPADRARLVQGLQQKGAVDNLEARFRRKNGEIAIGLMSARVLEINHEQCILSITRNITDRYNAEIALREAHIELEQAYTATLKGWAQALELRERETADHSRRVVELTIQLARKMGFEGETLLDIEHGALLHDIGKLGVPDNILLKPGALTNEEWNIMRQHPTYARDLLITIPYLVPSQSIPYCHHERWDGSGYPQGLAGEAIPLEARIFSVVDVYDALLSNRPYRPSWPLAEVLRYLFDQRGKQFDPQVVDLFLMVIEEKPVERV